jgi:hypothetical protein
VTGARRTLPPSFRSSGCSEGHPVVTIKLRLRRPSNAPQLTTSLASVLGSLPPTWSFVPSETRRYLRRAKNHLAEHLEQWGYYFETPPFSCTLSRRCATTFLLISPLTSGSVIIENESAMCSVPVLGESPQLGHLRVSYLAAYLYNSLSLSSVHAFVATYN